MKNFGIIIMVFLTLISCSEDKKEESKEKQNETQEYPNDWDENTVNGFMSECTLSLTEDVCSCSLEKVIPVYTPEEIDEANAEIINFISKAMNDCAENDSKPVNSEDMSGYWNEDNDAMFIQKCKESLSEEICQCSLEKIKIKYKPSDMDKGNDPEIVTGIGNAMKECMGIKTE